MARTDEDAPESGAQPGPNTVIVDVPGSNPSGSSASGDGHDHRHATTAPGSSPGSLVSHRDEQRALLHSRLRAAAVSLTIVFLFLFAAGYFRPSSSLALAAPAMLVRAILTGIVSGLLVASPVLPMRTLRVIEYVMFATLVVIGVATEYRCDRQLIESLEFARLIAFEKNGILGLFMLMVVYGVMIPNHPKTTALVVSAMGVAPITVWIVINYEEASRIAEFGSQLRRQTIWVNMLFVVIGGGLSVYTANLIYGLRGALHAARRLGQYHLREKLGEGGMGQVYLAEHQLLKRPCALKLIRPENESDPLARARFEREVRTAAMLTHPNTIHIFDYGRTGGGTFYYVMEYLVGMSVSTLVKRFGPLAPARVVYLGRQVCGALAEAHKNGLVHRDMKPANIYVAVLGGQYDVVKVLDFGLVKPIDRGAPQISADYAVSGTPMYMSPEQASASRELDGRSDLYAVGAVLYFMLTGRAPFEGSTAMELMIAHARDPVVPPTRLRPDIPLDLEAIVLTLLAKKAEDRFENARALSAALAACACACDWDATKAEEWWARQDWSPSDPHSGFLPSPTAP
jgi:serine/threonine-protein kinase